MRALLVIAALVASLAGAGTALAVAVDGQQLADPEQEARARAIMKEVRCLVCQNQSIEDSNADLARDLRVLVREQVATGATDAQVKAFLLERYGDWILLRPPVNARTALLWLAPALLLAAGGAVAWVALRRQARRPETAPLDDAERARLAALLEGDGQGPGGRS